MMRGGSPGPEHKAVCLNPHGVHPGSDSTGQREFP